MLASRWMLEVSTGATVADARNMRFDFGISGAESARRLALIAQGDPRLSDADGGPYDPRAGLRQFDGSASLGYMMSRRTTVVLFGSASRLSSEAARSPLVRARDGVTGGLVLAYGL
jgi:outer membrane scaffolding protein for murein synthesis (MipA/OmpV family)